MSVEAQPRQPASYDEWRDRRWRLVGGFVVTLWLATVVLAVALGQKHSDFATLEGALRDGSVSAVEVVGYPDGGISHGYARVELRWNGWVERYTEVMVVEPREPRGESFNREGLRVLTGDPVEALHEIDGDMRVTYSDRRSSPGHVLGWQLPHDVVWLAIAAWVGSILLAFNGPEPWRATRWGWAWFLILGGPVGLGLYVVLGGPLGIGRPRDPRRRLTGGWAFLIAAVFLGGSSRG